MPDYPTVIDPEPDIEDGATYYVPNVTGHPNGSTSRFAPPRTR